jgi:hypothetical protein
MGGDGWRKVQVFDGERPVIAGEREVTKVTSVTWVLPGRAMINPQKGTKRTKSARGKTLDPRAEGQIRSN